MPPIDEALATTPPIELDAGHQAAAHRYIEAIVRGDRAAALLGPEFQAREMERLWGTFVERYEAVTSGPFSKRGQDALRIALGAI